MTHDANAMTTVVCPPECNHGPDNYVAWHEWAEKTGRTHKQTRCPVCGLFTIWRKK
jgi:hypothetical protein